MNAPEAILGIDIDIGIGTGTGRMCTSRSRRMPRPMKNCCRFI
jgi:hypothetical protein